jgi:hypothetical protein
MQHPNILFTNYYTKNNMVVRWADEQHHMPPANWDIIEVNNFNACIVTALKLLTNKTHLPFHYYNGSTHNSITFFIKSYEFCGTLCFCTI